MIVHSILHDFDSRSHRFSFTELAWQIARPLVNALSSPLRERAIPEMAAESEDIMRQLALDDEGLLRMLNAGRRVELDAFNDIKESLYSAGWDTDKFMYSSVKSRVEF